MNDSGRDGSDRHNGTRDLDDCAVLFAPMARNGSTWLKITEPQPDARTACMSVAAPIHLLQPGIPFSELQARAEAAIRALEDGAASVPVIDDLHRVDRALLHPRHPLS